MSPPNEPTRTASALQFLDRAEETDDAFPGAITIMLIGVTICSLAGARKAENVVPTDRQPRAK